MLVVTGRWLIFGRAILVLLAGSLVTSFLLESNQEALQFLNSLQLRFLFAVVVSVGSFTAALCADLADPFRGSFCVSSAAAQLGVLELQLEVPEK